MHSCRVYDNVLVDACGLLQFHQAVHKAVLIVAEPLCEGAPFCFVDVARGGYSDSGCHPPSHGSFFADRRRRLKNEPERRSKCHQKQKSGSQSFSGCFIHHRENYCRERRKVNENEEEKSESKRNL